MPKTFVAVTMTGDVVVASTATGGVERVLAKAGKASVWDRPPSSDGVTVYYTHNPNGNCSEVWAVPIEGGTPRKIGRGSDPEVSTDHRQLAYTDSENCGDRSARVIVRNLRTGRQRTWTFQGELIGGVGGTAWMRSDDKFLVNECGFDSCGWLEIDPRKESNKLEGRPFGPKSVNGIESTSLSFSFPIVRGRLGTIIFDVENPGGGGAPKGVFEYQPARGTSREIFPERSRYGVQDADASGRFLLYHDDKGDLFAWEDGKSIRIGPGYLSASW